MGKASFEEYEGAIKREILRKGRFIVATKTSWIAMNSAMKKRLGLIRSNNMRKEDSDSLKTHSSSPIVCS